MTAFKDLFLARPSCCPQAGRAIAISSGAWTGSLAASLLIGTAAGLLAAIRTARLSPHAEAMRALGSPRAAHHLSLAFSLVP